MCDRLGRAMNRPRLVWGLLVGALVAALFVGLQWRAGVSAPAAVGSGAVTASGEAPVRDSDDSAHFMGLVWLDGTEPPMGTLVQAFVGGTECGERKTTIGGNVAGQWLHGFIGRAIYLMSVPSSDKRPGCGTAGASVTFWVDGKQAHQTGQWRSGDTQFLHLTVGAQPAIFSGNVTIDGGPVERGVPIQAFMDGVLCGELRVAEDSEPPMMKESEYRHLAVLASEARAGCETAGAQIRFLVRGMQAKETAVWEPGFHTLDLLITTAPEETATPAAEGLPETGRGNDDGPGLPWLAAASLGSAAAVAATAFVILRSSR